MKERSVHIFCDGGLGNRMNSLLGGMVLANELKRIPVVHWPANTWCGCLFNDLFDTNLNNSNLDVNLFFENYKNSVCFIGENQVNYQLNILPLDRENIEKSKNFNDEIVYSFNKIPRIWTHDQIISALSTLKINSDLIFRMKKFIQENKIDKSVIGLHVRLTDNPKKIDLEEIFQQVKKDQNSKYFLCSDDKNTELKFNELSNVIIHQKNSYVEKLVSGTWHESIIDNEGRKFNYNVNRPKESVIEALLDVLILSRCNLIFKKNKSTFYQLAKLYCNLDF